MPKTEPADQPARTPIVSGKAGAGHATTSQTAIVAAHPASTCYRFNESVGIAYRGATHSFRSGVVYCLTDSILAAVQSAGVSITGPL